MDLKNERIIYYLLIICLELYKKVNKFDEIKLNISLW
jgi:hypothetical protein